MRFASFDAAGNVNCAPGSILIVQIATSVVGSAAHESGGGGTADSPPNVPAITATSLLLPFASVATWRGTSSFQNILKCGSTIFDTRGKFNQICSNSVVFSES